MKLLNLDELTTIQREIQIQGQKYPIAERSVGQMLDAIKLAEHVNERPDDIKVVLESIISAVSAIVPTCPVEVLRTLNERKLHAIIEFANASDEEVIKASVAADEVSESSEGK